MKVSDYIVEYLISKGVKVVFGYPGGMVTHLMDSLEKRKGEIRSCLLYHEQGAAFAACGYAQGTNTIGVAYATSGPGATNLVTGICNAYFDSIPCLFITGQVNSSELKGNKRLRQRGFQETDIISMVKHVTKYAEQVTDATQIKYCLDKALWLIFEGRRGPALLDICMDVFRSEIEVDKLQGFDAIAVNALEDKKYCEIFKTAFLRTRRPLILVGKGFSNSCDLFSKVNIPVVTTMLATDIPKNGNLNYGFVGAYGSRTANFLVAKCDLLIVLGARLDIRQVGINRSNFAKDAMVIRVDIDSSELEYKVHDDEIDICADADKIADIICDGNLCDFKKFENWIDVCNIIKRKLQGKDELYPNQVMRRLSDFIPDNAILTTDVGQNQVWFAQSFNLKNKQKVLFSGGHGAMGYSLPASVGAAMAIGNPVYCFTGDGGLQMNIQELQTIAREKLPITIILFNNKALGMIRHFQEMYFNKNYTQTVCGNGYSTPDFSKIAHAYGLEYRKILGIEDITDDLFGSEYARFIEVEINEPTYVFPKLEFGKPNQDQEPLLDRDLYKELMAL